MGWAQRKRFVIMLCCVIHLAWGPGVVLVRESPLRWLLWPRLSRFRPSTCHLLSNSWYIFAKHLTGPLWGQWAYKILQHLSGTKRLVLFASCDWFSFCFCQEVTAPWW